MMMIAGQIAHRADHRLPRHWARSPQARPAASPLDSEEPPAPGARALGTSAASATAWPGLGLIDSLV